MLFRSSSNFVAIVRLVVLVRKDPGTTSPLSSLFDPVTDNCYSLTVSVIVPFPTH